MNIGRAETWEQRAPLALVAVAGAFAVGVIWWVSSMSATARPEADVATSPAPVRPALAAVSVPPAPVPVYSPSAVVYRGVALQLHTSHNAVADYGRAIDEIADLGANTLLLSIPDYMEHARAQAIFADVSRAPSPEQLAVLLDRAHVRGLRVILMPILLLSHPRGSEWRGVIDPPQWDEWWKQYEEFILRHADLAKAHNVAALTIGSELVSTEKYTSRWVELISRARARFPGELGYSANWDHYKPIQFWDRLDFVGMTSYYTLAKRENPSVAEIVAAWTPVRSEITDWLRDVGKPLILTEVGWCSQEGAASAPWNYYQNMKATPAGMEEQRRLYEGFLKAWDGAPGLAGVVWWEWTSGAGGTSDYGYTPKGKPAEAILRSWLNAGGAK